MGLIIRAIKRSNRTLSVMREKPVLIIMPTEKVKNPQESIIEQRRSFCLKFLVKKIKILPIRQRMRPIAIKIFAIIVMS